MGEVIYLVSAKISHDTISTLVSLLQEARAGQIIGLAFVALHQGSEYSVDIAGEVRQAPTHARGMVAVLDDQLSKMISD